MDKEQLSALVRKGQGNRSLNEYARKSGISNSYLSVLINMKEKVKSAPAPDVLRSLAEASGGTVSYIEFMFAAGHLTYEDISSHFQGIGESIQTVIRALSGASEAAEKLRNFTPKQKG